MTANLTYGHGTAVVPQVLHGYLLYGIFCAGIFDINDVAQNMLGGNVRA